MDQMWAPWRIPYILSEAQRTDRRGCIFCDLPAEGPEHFRDNLILCCGTRSLIILNRYPYNNGHLMVVPREHVSDPEQLSAADYRLVTELLRRATATLREATRPHAINLGMNLGRTAGAGIHEHCHYHLVPRWDGDTNFMPVTAGVKVISEGLLACYDRFFPFFKGLAQQVEAEMAEG